MDRLNFGNIFLRILLLSLAPLTPAWSLSPKDVVTRIIQTGLDAREIESLYQKAEAERLSVLGKYDWTLSSSLQYEFNQQESLSGLSDLERRTTSWNLGVTRRIPTGTEFSLNYGRTFQNSLLNPNLSTLKPSQLGQDLIEIGIRQEVMGNFFGVVDRAQLKIARTSLDKSQLEKKERLEATITQGLKLYWDTYVSREYFRQALSARSKYEQLVQTLRNQKRLGLVDPSDLSSVQAEYANQDRIVKSSSLKYLTLLDQLLTTLKLPLQEDIDFDIPPFLQKLPEFREKNPETLRTVQASKLGLENSELERRAARLSTLPTLTLYATAGFNGVETQSSDAFAEMTSLSRPRYVAGVELEFRLDSDAARSIQMSKEIQYDLAIVEVERARDRSQSELTRAKRDVHSKYLIAEKASEVVRFIESVVKDRERKFKAGRASTNDIIQDYARYYQAQADQSAALAEYYIALANYQATVDEVIP